MLAAPSGLGHAPPLSLVGFLFCLFGAADTCGPVCEYAIKRSASRSVVPGVLCHLWPSWFPAEVQPQRATPGFTLLPFVTVFTARCQKEKKRETERERKREKAQSGIHGYHKSSHLCSATWRRSTEAAFPAPRHSAVPLLLEIFKRRGRLASSSFSSSPFSSSPSLPFTQPHADVSQPSD